MRLLLVVFIYTITLPVCGQVGFSLDELIVKRYDSKKKYPATVLRYEPDAFSDLVTTRIYKGKSLYTGNIDDQHDGVTTKAVVLDGAITNFTSVNTESDSWRMVYSVTQNGYYPWYATDSVYYGEYLFSSAIFYQKDDGNLMMVTRFYDSDNYVNEYSERIGIKSGGKIEYFEPMKDGLQCGYHNGILLGSETFQDGIISGEVVEYDENKTVLQKYNVSALVGVYGRYYEYDKTSGIATVGYYSDRGIEAGIWISKYADSSVAQMLWFGANGNPDSSKNWDYKGNLTAVEYNYWRPSKNPQVKDYIHYSKSWYSNAQVNMYHNYNPSANDTIFAYYDVTGILLEVQRNYNGRIQRRTWAANGQPETERYGIQSGISGVTMRDSVYRRWGQNGMLASERYYVNGRFDSAGIPVYWDPLHVIYSGPAYTWLVNNPDPNCTWDTCAIVPGKKVDSLAMLFDNVYLYCKFQNAEAFPAVLSIQETQSKGSTEHPYCIYNLVLTDQESVKLDVSGNVVTTNPALNSFLDSLGIKGVGVAPLGNFTKKKKGKVVSDFSVTTTDISVYLNLFYINRRLEQLSPGSSLTIYQEPGSKLAPELIYIPQGSSTAMGVSPVSVFAVAAAGTPRTYTSANKTVEVDARTFYVFHIYGDGEVEFARTADKSTILKQYKGDRSGAILKPR